MKLFSHQSHFAQDKSFLYLDGRDGYTPAEATSPEEEIVSEFDNMSFEEALTHLENGERTKLTNYFKRLYSKYDNDNHTEEINLRVENIIEKMRLLAQETQKDKDTPPVDAVSYRRIINKYTQGAKQEGNIGALENRFSSVFLPGTQGHELSFSTKITSTPLKNWLRAKEYTFKRGNDTNGIEIWCKGDFVAYVPRNIVEIWPILVNGEVQGFVTMDGDGDMASRFADGSMHFLKEVRTGEGENATINVEEDRKGEPKRAKFDAGAESEKRRTLEDYGDKKVGEIVQETAFKVAQATQPAATPAAQREPSPQTPTQPNEPPTTPADQADSEGSQPTPPQETVPPQNQPEPFPNIDKLPQNILKALETLSKNNLLTIEQGAKLGIIKKGKIYTLKLTPRTGANTPETSKALFTIANSVLPEGTTFPDTCEESISQIFIDNKKLFSYKLDAENVGRKLNDGANLFFSDLPPSKYRRIRIYKHNWELSLKENGSFTATKKGKEGEDPKMGTVHGIGRRDDTGGGINIGFIDAEGNWIQGLGSQRVSNQTEPSAQATTPHTPPPIGNDDDISSPSETEVAAAVAEQENQTPTGALFGGPPGSQEAAKGLEDQVGSRDSRTGAEDGNTDNQRGQPAPSQPTDPNPQTTPTTEAGEENDVSVTIGENEVVVDKKVATLLEKHKNKININWRADGNDLCQFGLKQNVTLENQTESEEILTIANSMVSERHRARLKCARALKGISVDMKKIMLLTLDGNALLPENNEVFEFDENFPHTDAPAGIRIRVKV